MTPAAEDVDCERHDDSFLGQDVAAWTSLGYVAVGVAVAVVGVRRGLPRPYLALAAVALLEGIGSVLYHGGSGDAAQVLHDAPLIGLLGFISGWHVGRLARASASGSGALAGLGAGLVLGGVASAVGLTNVASGVAVAVIVIAEVLARRRRRPAVWTASLLVLVGIAIATWYAGTSGSPLCDEESLVQPHGVWHLLSALVVLTWFDQAAAIDAPTTAPRLWRRATDRALGLLTIVLTLAFYRSVEVSGRDHVPAGRPMLVVANHGNGLVDPIVVASALRRLPRFLAKAALWRIPVARPFLAAAGVLPVYRRADGDAGGNHAVFEACHLELARGRDGRHLPRGHHG